MLLRSNFSSFPHYFIYIFLTSGVKLYIHLLNVIVQFIVFLTLSTLICRGTDISKCFRESLGIRDNEIRLYSLPQMCCICIGEVRNRKVVKYTDKSRNYNYMSYSDHFINVHKKKQLLNPNFWKKRKNAYIMFYFNICIINRLLFEYKLVTTF